MKACKEPVLRDGQMRYCDEPGHEFPAPRGKTVVRCPKHELRTWKS